MNKLIHTIFLLTFLTLTTAVFAQHPVSLKKDQPTIGDVPMEEQARTSGGIAFLILVGLAYGSRKLYSTFTMEQQH